MAAVLAAPDGGPIFVVPWCEKSLMRVDLAKKKSVPFVKVGAKFECAAMSADGGLVVIGDMAGGITVVDTKTGKPTRSRKHAHDDCISGVASRTRAWS